MHEIGDGAYQVDNDNIIDEKDALQGILLAAQVIGAKYIEPKVDAFVKSPRLFWPPMMPYS